MAVRFVDTNIFLRYLAKPVTAADQTKQAACLALFQRARAGDEVLTTCEAVIAEVLYVLCAKAHYGLSHQDAAARLRPLLTLRGLHLPQKRLYFRALDLFASDPGLDIEDALIVAHMEQRGIRALLSYDRDFDSVRSVSRQEP